MKIIHANATLMDAQTAPYENETPYQFIERIGRTCYKSEEYITKESAVKFVQMMAKSKHYAMLEHYRIIFKANKTVKRELEQELAKIRLENPNADFTLGSYLKITPSSEKDMFIISGSFRTWREITDVTQIETIDVSLPAINAFHTVLALNYNALFQESINRNFYAVDMFNTYAEFEATETNDKIRMAHIPHTVKFVCDRGVTHELVRHRPASFAQESTRYCNYGKDKFGNEITVVEPCFYYDKEDSKEYQLWYNNSKNGEDTYFALVALGSKPQEARDNLPASVKTELFSTATEDEWQHIIDLRYHGVTGAPHPQAKEVMTYVYDDLLTASKNRLK